MANREPIQYVDIDVDYCTRTYADGMCGASLIARAARINRVLWSEDFTNAYWNKAQSTIISTTQVPPSFQGTAQRIADTAATAIHRVESGYVTLGVLVTASVFVKSSGRTQAFLQVLGNSGAPSVVSSTLIVNLTDGSIVSGTAREVVDIGSGWWRISVDATTLSGDYSLRVGPALSGTTSYLGDGTSGILAWGAQLESIQTVNPSPYKATTTTTVSAVWDLTGVRKCFNTFGTCQYKSVFNKSVKTLRFINNRSNLKKDLTAYPVLQEQGVSSFSSTVNIAGSDPKMSAFGRRATVSVGLSDFVDDDIGFDKYVQERISGVAQVPAVGYKPVEQGTFFTRLKARWPHYVGRPLRVTEGYTDDGILTVDQTRNFIITDVKGPDDKGKVTIEAKDVLALADDKKALAPTPSRGKINTAMTAVSLTAVTLTPTGIGSEYATSGFATIGSEVISFTRSGDVITPTGRGLKGTSAATHSIGDSFQQALNFSGTRVDDAIYTLLNTYAKVPASFLPKTTEWAPEITRWMPSVLLDTIITKPTGVAQLVGELADLGVSVWWDDVAQKVKILANHPATDTTIVEISDRDNIKAISQEDRDEDRITQVHYYTRQTDPTKDYKDKSNYNQINVLIDTDAEGTNAYNDTKVREVFCRWLNNGADAVVRTLALRLLKRFNTPPIHYTITLDVQDRGLALGGVFNLNSRVVTDEAGLPVKKLVQIFRLEETRSGHEFKVSVQDFNYNGKYGQIMANGSPVYTSATDTQKRLGAYFVNGTTLVFSDRSLPYAFT